MPYHNYESADNRIKNKKYDKALQTIKAIQTYEQEDASKVLTLLKQVQCQLKLNQLDPALHSALEAESLLESENLENVSCPIAIDYSDKSEELVTKTAAI